MHECLSCMHVCIPCACMVPAKGQKRVSDPLGLTGVWKLNLGPLRQQAISLTAMSCPQPLVRIFILFLYMYMCVHVFIEWYMCPHVNIHANVCRD